MKGLFTMKKTVLFRIFVLVMCIIFVACDSKTIISDVENQTAQTGVAVIESPKSGEISGVNNQAVVTNDNNREINNDTENAKIKDFFNKYLISFNEAISKNDFSKVEVYYLKGSDAHISHNNFVKSLNKSGEKFEVLNIDVKEIKVDVSNPNQLNVYLFERTSYTAPNGQEKISESGFVYVLVNTGNSCMISQSKDWKEHGVNIMTENTSQENKGNIIDKSLIKVGDIVCGLTVESIDIKNGYVNDITFNGEIELSGDYEWVADGGEGGRFILTVDSASLDKMPLLKDLNNLHTIAISNTDYAKKYFTSESGSVSLILSNYSIGERQIVISADLSKVIE
jgi:hypothetical protein